MSYHYIFHNFPSIYNSIQDARQRSIAVMLAKRLVMHTFLLSLQVWMYALTERERERQKRNADILYTMTIWSCGLNASTFASMLTPSYTVVICVLCSASFPLDGLSVLKRHKSSSFISCHAVSSTLQFWFLRIQLPEMILKECKSRLWICPNLSSFIFRFVAAAWNKSHCLQMKQLHPHLQRHTEQRSCPSGWCCLRSLNTTRREHFF